MARRLFLFHNECTHGKEIPIDTVKFNPTFDYKDFRVWFAESVSILLRHVTHDGSSEKTVQVLGVKSMEDVRHASSPGFTDFLCAPLYIPHVPY